MRGHLVIMARPPRLGVGKRRLARELGDLAAWRFYRLSLGATVRRLGGDRRWTTWLAVTPDRAALRPRGATARLRVTGQGPGGLDRRMAALLAGLPPGPVVIVGSDIPGIEARHVAAAFRALGRRPWVLGPARDGGYWLFGARRRPRFRLPQGALEETSWRALAARLAAHRGEAPALLETLADVDRAADLEAVSLPLSGAP